jgi:hypothetical protein
MLILKIVALSPVHGISLRIRQIEAKALRKLRHPSRSRRLKAFVDGVKEI